MPKRAINDLFLLLSNSKERGTITDTEYEDMMKFVGGVHEQHKEVSVDYLKKDVGYDAFKHAVGKRESGGNYAIKNSIGFLGKFQFGLARLTDFGLCQRKEGCKGYSNKSFEWVLPYSEKVFLGNHKLQDAVFDKHIENWRKYIMKNFSKHLNKELQGHYLDLSGMLGCVHLLGPGGVRDFIKGDVGKDAYGTSATDYIDLFAGYEIPTKWKDVSLRSLV